MTQAGFYIVHAWPSGYGKSEPVDISPIVESMAYEDTEEKADKLSLVIDNFELQHFQTPVLRKGMMISAQWGYPGNVSPERLCVIQSIKGFAKLKVEALDKSVVANKAQHSRVFENMKRSDVARQMAKEQGFSPDRIFVDDTEVVYETIAQVRITDAAFLKDLANREGFEFYVDWDGFHWHERRLNAKPKQRYVYYLGDPEPNMWDVNTDDDVTAKPARAKAKGKDANTKEEIDEKGDNDSTDRDGLGSDVNDPFDFSVDEQSGEKRSTQYGKDIVYPETTISLSDNRTDTPRVASADSHEIPSTAPNAAAAKREADARYKKSAMASLKLTFTTWGDPQQYGKCTVEMVFPVPALCGNYWVAAVKHNLARSGGYVMNVTLKRDGANKAGNKSKAKQNDAEAPEGDDPEQLYMVDEQSGEKSNPLAKDVMNNFRPSRMPEPKNGKKK